MKKNKLISFYLVVASGVVLLSSCVGNGSSRPSRSSKTGWEYNKKENGGFEVHKKVNPGPGPGLVPVEGGTFVMGGSLDVDLAYDHNSARRRVTVSSFYMDETEVSNVDWLEYLHWIKRNFPQDRAYYHEALPDTLVWRRALSYNEPYVDNYLRHPAYGDYPVVGVTWEQAVAYCSWRTDRVNEEILRSKGVLTDWKTLADATNPKIAPKGKGGKSPARSTVQVAPSDSVKPFNTDVYLAGQYRGQGVDGKNMPIALDGKPLMIPAPGAAGKKGAKIATPARRTVGVEDGILKQPYRLPTEAEWEYAALALAGNTDYENVSDGRIYPWSGLGVRSSKQSTRGLIVANFKRRGGDLMGTGGYLNDKASITAEVRSFIPNDFGLYNMAGNVSEWTADVYRQLTFQDVEDLNPYRGNQFVNKKSVEDGKTRKLILDKHGVPVREASISNKKLSWDQMNAAPLGVKSDSSSVDSSSSQNGTSVTVVKSEKPFKADVRDYNDTTTNNLYGITSLVNNKSRVYKGASWNDRAYWLNPATRRHLQEDECSAEIGFRCAMTMVGSPEIYTEDKPHLKVKSYARLTETRKKKGIISINGKR